MNAAGGDIVEELPDGRYPNRKNRVYFVPAWVRFSCHNIRPLEHFYVHFDVVGLNDVISRKIFSRPVCLEEKKFTELVRVHKLHELAQSRSPYGICRVKALVYDYYAKLLENLSPEKKTELSRSLFTRNRFIHTLQYIDNHLSQDLNNVQLAKISHMSESYFAHCFKDTMGQTPARYVLERRIAAAARQLIFTQDSIDQISERMGFANRFHFSRNFTQLMGVTPGVYRKTTRV